MRSDKIQKKKLVNCQSRKHIEFKEKVNNFIQIYDDNKHNPATNLFLLIN